MLDYAAVVLAVFVASVISGLGGFGGALIIIVVLTPIVGARAVVPLIAVYAVFSNVSRVIVTFGFISGAAAGTGLLAIAALLNMGLQGPLLLGTDAVIGIVNASSRVVSYWSLDLLDRDLFLLGLLMGLASFPGTWIASVIV